MQQDLKPACLRSRCRFEIGARLSLAPRPGHESHGVCRGV